VLIAHRTLALVVVILALGGTLWAVHDWLRVGALHPRLLTFTIAMSAVIGLQALFGILLAVGGNRPIDGSTHFVVGPLTLVVLPLTRRLVVGRSDRAASAFYAVGWFVLLLLTLRAVGSGGGIGG
jgi:hypothetical protein